MHLDLTKILDSPGASISFQERFDLSDLVFGTCRPAKEPVLAEGVVRNTAGVLLLTGQVIAQLDGICDRCAAPFQRDVSYPMEATLLQEPCSEETEDEWVFELDGNQADLDDIVRTVFILNMDSKLLCRDDCKGLCCQCGANLNLGPCRCEKELDPRFAALKQLLKDE